MRKFILRLLIKYLDNPMYTRLKKDKVLDLLDHIANDPASQDFTDYLDQLADGYKNQFLYTQDPHYKGMIAGYTVLRETITERRDAKIAQDNKKAKALKKGKKRIVKY
jgi:hypothetical protein